MKFKDAVLLVYGELPKKIIEDDINNPYGLETVHELCECCGGEGHWEDSVETCSACNGNGYIEKGKDE